MHLQSKLTSQMCQKIESLDGKTKHNRLKNPTLPFFFPQTSIFIERQQTFCRIFIVKVSVPTNFMCLRLEVPSEICQKEMSLNLRTIA